MIQLKLREELFHSAQLDTGTVVTYTVLATCMVVVAMVVSIYEARRNVLAIEILVSLILRISAAVLIFLTETPLYYLAAVPVLSVPVLLSFGRYIMKKKDTKTGNKLDRKERMGRE